MSHCQLPPCHNGHCAGCRAGKEWFDAPRCFPYCSGCKMPKNHDTNAGIVVGIIAILLGAAFIILLIGYGPRFIEARQRGVEVNHQYDWFSKEIIIE